MSEQIEAMSVRQIVAKWLGDNGYDGLYEPGECACIVDDLAPCGSECFINCRAGYRSACDCDEEHEFHIGPRRVERIKEADNGNESRA